LLSLRRLLKIAILNKRGRRHSEILIAPARARELFCEQRSSGKEIQMIQRMSHFSIFVLNQDQAKDFYVNKLGFDLRSDTEAGGLRWLTVSPKGQPEVQIVLLPVRFNNRMDEAAATKITELLQAGQMPTHVFSTADCQKTYEELKAKGVEFVSPPKEQFYGTEAVLKDPFGNRYSLTQPKTQM
jgi:predicted enzyme related to lactoylglutathione lyase